HRRSLIRIGHATEADMAGRAVRRRGRARGVAVAPAVGRMAKIAAAAHRAVRSIIEPIGAPLPAVADHVVQPKTVGQERVDRREAIEAVAACVVVWKCALPDVAAMLAARRLGVAPGKTCTLKPAA